MKVGQPKQTVTTLQGPWSKGINTKKCEIELATRLAIPVKKDIPRGDEQPLADYELLLGTQTDPKVSQVTPIATHVTYVSWSGADGGTNGSLLSIRFGKADRQTGQADGDRSRAGNRSWCREREAGGPPIQLKQADEPARPVRDAGGLAARNDLNAWHCLLAVGLHLLVSNFRPTAH